MTTICFSACDGIHFIETTRGHRTMPGVVSFLILGRFEARTSRVHSLKRSGDGVERVTTLSDAIAATASSSSSIRALSRYLLRLGLRELRLALHGVALLGLGVDGLPEAIELLLEGGDLLLRE